MDDDLQRLIGWFLWYLDCGAEELARLAGVSESSVRKWKKGQPTPSRANVEKLAKAAGLPMAFIDVVVLPHIATVRLGQAAEEEVFRDLGAAARALEASLAGAGRSAVAELVGFLEQEPTHEREDARAQCERLKSREAADLWYLIENRPEFQARELALLLALESIEAASDDAARALLLARVAHRVAELVRGEQRKSSALEGLTLAIVANAQRVGNDFEEVERSFEQALALWQASEESERAMLPGWRLLDLEASHCRDRRRFPRALKLLDDAQAAAPREDIPRILVNRAVTLEHMGNPEGAIEVLQEAAQRAEGQKDPRLHWAIQFNLAANLCFLDKHREAGKLLPKIQELALAIGCRKELNEIRTVWLRSRIDAGLGRVAEARAGFDRVREDLRKRKMAADYALASLERAALDLREGRNAEARVLAEEMKWIFEAKGLHPEARAALTLFRTAAAREQATADLADRMVRYLYRARYDPELKFAA